jgi:hypothetical protein
MPYIITMWLFVAAGVIVAVNDPTNDLVWLVGLLSGTGCAIGIFGLVKMVRSTR